MFDVAVNVKFVEIKSTLLQMNYIKCLRHDLSQRGALTLLDQLILRREMDTVSF